MTSREDIVRVPEMAGGPGGSSSISLFLSLFLLVLAFFIILVSISTVEKVKSDAVKNSLTSTFKAVLTPSTDPTDFTSRDGDILAGQPFQAEVTGIFATTIQVAKVEIVQPGKLMQIKLPTVAMFVNGKPEIRPVAAPVLDRVVAALSTRPPGLRFDMEFVIGSPYASGSSLPTEQTLQMLRAGSFAREMFRRGVPPDSVAVGLRPGKTDEVSIWFFMRSESEAKLPFNFKEAGDGSS